MTASLIVNLKREAGCYTPMYATKGAAGADLATPSRLVIHPGQMVSCNTGIAVEIPPMSVGLVFGRSGLAFKHGLRLANSVAVIDSDFRGNIIVGLFNDGPTPVVLEAGDRIAQLVLVPCFQMQLIAVDNLADSERGTGGLGSTGMAQMEDAVAMQNALAETSRAAALHEDMRQLHQLANEATGVSVPTMYMNNIKQALAELDRDEGPTQMPPLEPDNSAQSAGCPDC